MAIKHWNILKSDKNAARELQTECGIDPFCALLLTVRGIVDATDAEEFLSDEYDFCDPMNFADMEKAVKRIQNAIENNEKIAIFGDYDCDGVTATAVMYTYLCSVGADVIYRLPSRDEGYGLSKNAVDEFINQQISLIITVDNGISANEAVDYANKNGIDTVITDHHIPPETLPNAAAAVDPKRLDCPSEFKGFAGVGVAFMTVCALEGCAVEEMLPEYADLTALGTIADVMPMKYDNRAIVKYGLNMIKHKTRGSIAALIDAAGMGDKEINTSTVSFCISPRINAAGRMLTPEQALELLLCDDKLKAAEYARELCDLNLQRQKLESDIIAQAEQSLFEDEESLNRPITVVWGENWHHGVLGLIAGKIAERYSHPCIALSIDGDIACGSARSVSGVSIYSLIASCSDLLISFGGHESAAGLRLKTDNLQKFSAAINNAAHEIYPLMPFNELELCLKLNPNSLDIPLVYSQNKLEPFGSGNETPVFGLYNMKIVNITSVGKGNHLRLTVAREQKTLTVMKFFTLFEQFEYKIGDTVDLAVTLKIDRFADAEKVSAAISEIKPSNVDNDYLTKRIRAYENFRAFGEKAQSEPITRDFLVTVYKKIAARKHIFASEDSLLSIFGCDDFFSLRVALDILKEGGLIAVTHREFIEISILPALGKVDLTKTPTYIKINSEVKE